MKPWERSIMAALGQCEAARKALVGVGGHLMPDETRNLLRIAEESILKASNQIVKIVQANERGEWTCPWNPPREDEP